MSDPERCIAEFSILERSPALEPRFNIAPSQGVWVVRMLRAGGGLRLDLLRWGLPRRSATAGRSLNGPTARNIPDAQRTSTGNARGAATGDRPHARSTAAGGLAMVRAESLATRASFAEAFRSRRCLFLADGFYEWRKAGGRSYPYYIHRPGDAPFVMAGIWYPAAHGASEESAPLDACAVITRAARPPIDAVHDRMPAMLAREHCDAWLDPDYTDTEALTRMLEADPDFTLETQPVGPRVNSPANDDAFCVAPATDVDRRGEQFELWPRDRAFRTG
jgi:putative SOS response-associated peptidase YedK